MAAGENHFDVVDDLKEGDIVLEGANALDLLNRRAAILIGDPRGGTILAVLQAVIGRRVRLLLPVGLEACFRRPGATGCLGSMCREPKGQGSLPVFGEVISEIEAVSLLTGATAELVAGAGLWGRGLGTPCCQRGTRKGRTRQENIGICYQRNHLSHSDFVYTYPAL